MTQGGVHTDHLLMTCSFFFLPFFIFLSAILCRKRERKWLSLEDVNIRGLFKENCANENTFMLFDVGFVL